MPGPSADELALRAEANMRVAIRGYAEAAEGGDALDIPGAVASRVAAPIRAFNQALITPPVADGAPVRRALQWYAGRPKYRIRLREHLKADIVPVLEEVGLVPRGGIPCMALAPIAAIEPLSANGLDIRRVDASNIADHVLVVAEAFGWEPAQLARVFTPALASAMHWRGFTGYCDGEPVATAQLVVAGGVAGLYYIGVRGAWRSRGFGEAITRHAIVAGAAEGCDMSSLQASDMGRPVYERIGFAEVAYYRTLAPPD